MENDKPREPAETLWTAWAVHVYTATGTLMAFFAAQAAFTGNFRTAFLWLFTAVLVDATDGWLARLARVHERLPHFSGQKLDDLVDYLTFVFVPVLIVWRAGLLPSGWGFGVYAAMLLSSAYGFANEDAKTSDHFFTGFPSYWNVAALYLMVGKLPPALNGMILFGLAALVFVRIRYIYPTRTPTWRQLTLTLSAFWSMLLFAIIFRLPSAPRLLVWLSLLFPAYYALLSLVLHARLERSSPRTEQERQ